MRGGLWSSFWVPGAGTCTRVEPNCDARQGDGKATVRRRIHAGAGEAGLELLIGGKGIPPSSSRWPAVR